MTSMGILPGGERDSQGALSGQIGEKAAGVNHLPNKGRKDLGLVALAPGEIADDPLFQVHLQLVARLAVGGGLRALQDRQADVDGVAVKDPGEGGGNDAGDAAGLDGDGACSREEPQPKFSPATM